MASAEDSEQEGAVNVDVVNNMAMKVKAMGGIATIAVVVESKGER